MRYIIHIQIPEELQDLLDGDENLEIESLDLRDGRVVIYDRRNNRSDYWQSSEDIEFEII